MKCNGSLGEKSRTEVEPICFVDGHDAGASSSETFQ